MTPTVSQPSRDRFLFAMSAIGQACRAAVSIIVWTVVRVAETVADQDSSFAFNVGISVSIAIAVGAPLLHMRGAGSRRSPRRLRRHTDGTAPQARVVPIHQLSR